MKRPIIAVHKFSSCDGCQLAFLNAGRDLLRLAERVEIRHFLEAGFDDPGAQADVAFIEGSISTAEEAARVRQIRENSRNVVTIGACATSGGLQALRNLDDCHDEWKRAVYARPEFIETLDRAEPVSAHVTVDFELWGCPVNAGQVLTAVQHLLLDITPQAERDKLCLDCKRRQAVCVMVTEGRPCMGPVTRTGCGALCPRFGRDCYACFGPSETPNTDAQAQRLAGLGLPPDDVARRFLFINSQAPAFREAVEKSYRSGCHDE